MKTFKSLLLAVLLLSFLPKIYAQNDSIQISGVLKGLGNKSVWISFSDDAGVSRSFKANGNNDAFKLKLPKLKQPSLARFDVSISRGMTATVNGQTIANPAPRLELFVFNQNITLSGEALYVHLAKVHGDEENNALANFKSSVYKEERRNYDNSLAMFNAKYHGGKAVKEDALMAEITANGKKVFEQQRNFIQGNPDALAAVFLLSRSQNIYTAGNYTKVWNSLSDKYKDHPLAKGIKAYVKKMSSTLDGAEAIDFERKDKDGNTIKLSNYKGKTVLLDFWGSWCGPCRASHPHLKTLYSRYKDKGFEIVAIAQEQGKNIEAAKKSWLKAIEEDQITWKHILNQEGIEKQDLVKSYNIIAFPTKILVNAEGKIVLRITSSATDDIDKALAKIYGF
ncbi:TlpA family protein disulfide reductase [Pedobacter rhizosphaerae]|uniref:Glutathione peroxidase, house-cleaning role in reducing lipid peroxides n=1 Tax=Pedobacter rhizosphaerae TaxID=390241 RepID=A0A1H9IXF3_9SPHI|nr:TlpA disulfide reductase family protein [Pedobacter rhizosphaerae]SEQ79260.1 Glutathione peroxidase, house-cleaning role in reducing lipid peroxides [Pedobacter rhizosphaerae]